MEELLINVNQEEKNKQKEERIVKSWGSKDQDAYYRANCFSKLFFYWAFRIIKLANSITIREEHLGKLEGYNKSSNYIQSIFNVWDKKGYKKSKKCGLFCTILRANVCTWICLVFLNIFNVLLQFSSVYLFRQYIKMFDNTYVPPFEFFTKMNVGLTFLEFKFFEIITSRHANSLQTQMGYKSSIELNCMIYNKILTASQASLNEKSKEGEIINFIQVDSIKLAMTMITSPTIIIVPIQIVVYTLMLFEFFGISFLFGFGVLVTFIVINFCIQIRYRALQKDILKKKDARMKITTQVINGLKIVKLYAWEDEFLKRIQKARDEELGYLKKGMNLSTASITLLWCAPIFVSVSSIGAYQYFNKLLKIEDIFTAISIFSTIQEPIRNLPWMVSNLIETLISLKRIQKYLSQDDIDPHKLKNNEPETMTRNVSVKISNGNFTWGVDFKEKEKEKKKVIPKEELQINDTSIGISKSDLINDENSRQNDNNPLISNQESSLLVSKSSIDNLPLQPRTVLKNINLEIKKGEFVCIIGEVGSGKSSLLQAMLNNMLSVESNTDIIINGKVSYVSQVPWIQNDTVKGNILFNSNFDENRYNYVLDICELRPDLQILVGGEMTEIGEKGINLSGGQKARISIARALYADSDVFMFDDPISALDAHVGQSIMKKCMLGYLENKTRILVTHALQYLPGCDRILYMNNGEIKWEGTYEEILKEDFFNEFSLKLKKQESVESNLEKELEKIEEQLDTSKPTLERSQSKSKEKSQAIKRIIKDEDIEKGNVKMEVYISYLNYMGGICLFIFVVIVMMIWQALKGGSDLWLSYWTKNQDEKTNLFNFYIYTALGMSSTIFVFLRVFTLTRGSVRCARSIHEEMIKSLVAAPINLYHDTVPKGQILNRLSKDLTQVEVYSMFLYGSILAYFFSFVGALIICSFVETYCLIFLPFLFFIGWFVTRFYIKCSRELSRLDGTTRSPILNLVSETIPGTSTLRAFKYENLFLNKFYDRVDNNYKIRLLIIGTAQWFGLINDILSYFFMVFLIIFTVLFESLFSAGSIGILLIYSIQLQENLFDFLSVLSNIENSMISMERCLKYTKIQSELPYIKAEDNELDEWPSQGEVKFVNYSTKYRPDTEIVLKNISFTVNPGEKVGIVGRTGSGKSTICLALFRILEPFTGKIIIDDVDISTIGLKKLRSSLTIIPQDPILVEGTLKYNIDPLNLYDDYKIMEVMKMIGFWYICENNPQGLEQLITENGTNLSVGEKQLICIARAILRVLYFFILYRIRKS